MRPCRVSVLHYMFFSGKGEGPPGKCVLWLNILARHGGEAGGRLVVAAARHLEGRGRRAGAGAEAVDLIAAILAAGDEIHAFSPFQPELFLPGAGFADILPFFCQTIRRSGLQRGFCGAAFLGEECV